MMINSNIIHDFIRSNSISSKRSFEKKPAFPRPIASYRCYDKSNEEEDRDVLRDLTGNGHDIQLYNFAFNEESGYGKYNINLLDLIKDNPSNSSILYSSYKKIVFHNTEENKINLYKYVRNPQIGIIEFGGFGINIEGLSDKESMRAIIYSGDDFFDTKTIRLVNGYNFIDKFTINVITENSGYKTFIDIRTSEILNKNITIELLPDYKGALVSDGVDDYGLCENFPILTKDKGYTVCAIRNYILSNVNGCFLSNRETNTNFTAFSFELALSADTQRADSFNNVNYIQIKKESLFSYQTSVKYNNIDIVVGSSTGSKIINLFKLNSTHNDMSFISKAALYSLEIYDRDLTDEEIAKVKARMMAEYEAKTGDVETQFLMEDGSKFLMEDGSKFIME